MSVWLRLLRSWARRETARMLGKVLEKARPGSVDEARTAVKAWVQSKRRLPGEVRRWLCRQVDAADGESVDAFRKSLLDRLA